LISSLQPSALPKSIRGSESTFIFLAQVYKQINAPVGQLGRQTLNISTTAMESTDSTKYNALESQLVCITNGRNNIASQMITLLNGAEFQGQHINQEQAQDLINQANSLLQYVHQLNQDATPGNCMASLGASNSTSG